MLDLSAFLHVAFLHANEKGLRFETVNKDMTVDLRT